MKLRTTDKKNINILEQMSEEKMQEKITLIFETADDKNSFLESHQNSEQIRTVTMEQTKFFIRNKKILNNEINNIITLLITGGTLNAIIAAVKKIIIQYIQKGNTVISIQKGNCKLKIEYDNKSSKLKVEDIITDELIRELFVSEDAQQDETE